MSYSIFISYRREDSTLAVSSFFKDLENEFGSNQLFVDRSSIKLGDPWPEVIIQALKESKIVLVVISNNWLCTEKDNPDQFRLCNEKDWVRQEIETAQSLGKLIIPVLANIPAFINHPNLPVSIQKLSGLDYETINTQVGDNAVTNKFINFLRKKLEYLNSPDDLRIELENILVDKYEINTRIGAGMKAKVYLGKDKGLERNVAIKAILDRKYNDEFLESLKTAAKMTDSAPNFISILGAYVEQEPYHVIMNFFSKGSLRRKINAEKRLLSFEKVKKILVNIGRALIEAHNIGLTHCNVMPSNIILGDQENAYLNSLSLRKIQSSELLIDTLYTTYELADKLVYKEELCYLAPEIFDKDDVDAKKIDQYMLGLVGYELLTGNIPDTFHDIKDLKDRRLNAYNEMIPVTQKRDECPEQFAKIIEKMISKDPRKRYDSLKDAIDLLDKISLKEYEIANDSYRRCMNDGEYGNIFFQAFYNRLINLLPSEEAEKFKMKGIGETKTNKQYAILREAIYILLLFSQNPPGEVEPNMLTRIAEMHNKKNYDITPDLYDYFTLALTDTICGDSAGTEPFDRHCKSEKEKLIIKEAWLKALKPGLDYMKSKYRK